MSTWIFRGNTVIIGVFLVACSLTSQPDTVELGMTEEEARTVLEARSTDSGVVYYGGSGRRRVYFELGPYEQTWFELGPGPSGKVVWVGPTEPRQAWTHHRGNSITIQ